VNNQKEIGVYTKCKKINGIEFFLKNWKQELGMSLGKGTFLFFSVLSLALNIMNVYPSQVHFPV
jgi:hypothetical protein